MSAVVASPISAMGAVLGASSNHEFSFEIRQREFDSKMKAEESKADATLAYFRQAILNVQSASSNEQVRARFHLRNWFERSERVLFRFSVDFSQKPFRFVS